MDFSIGDPWLLLTAFGFVGSAGLLVYLVRQLNAASEEDDEEQVPLEEFPVSLSEDPALAQHESAGPAPVLKPEPPFLAPREPIATLRPDVKVADADMLTEVMGASQKAPAPAEYEKAERRSSELSPAVDFIKALHEDIQTFHWEIQGIKKKLDHFEENQQKQMEFMIEKLQHLERETPAPKTPPSSGTPPTPFQ